MIQTKLDIFNWYLPKKKSFVKEHTLLSLDCVVHIIPSFLIGKKNIAST